MAGHLLVLPDEMRKDSQSQKVLRVATVALATAAGIPNSRVPAKPRPDGVPAPVARGTQLAASATDRSVSTEEAHARDSILLVGDVRLQRVLGLIAAPRVFTAQFPLDAIALVERRAADLHTVVVSTELAWASELREWMAVDHPTIRVLLLAPTV